MDTKPHKNLWHVVFTALLLVTIGLLIWFIFDLRSLYRIGVRPAGFNRDRIHKQILSPNQIQGWMTFSYINYIFNLPPNYFQDSLAIQDSRYPNLNIFQYAKTKGLAASDFLKQIQDSVASTTKAINR